MLVYQYPLAIHSGKSTISSRAKRPRRDCRRTVGPGAPQGTLLAKENHGKMLGNVWANDGKMMGKWWFCRKHVVGKWPIHDLWREKQAHGVYEMFEETRWPESWEKASANQTNWMPGNDRVNTIYKHHLEHPGRVGIELWLIICTYIYTYPHVLETAMEQWTGYPQFILHLFTIKTYRKKMKKNVYYLYIMGYIDCRWFSHFQTPLVAAFKAHKRVIPPVARDSHVMDENPQYNWLVY